jgi:DNA modification methylase
MIACELENRACYMMELDPQYCQVIIDRWEEITGKKAQKAAVEVEVAHV